MEIEQKPIVQTPQTEKVPTPKKQEKFPPKPSLEERILQKQLEQEEKKEKLLMIKLNNFVKLRPFINRYTRKVQLEDRFGPDQWVRQHSNKLLLFGITETHQMITRNSPIKIADWKICGANIGQLKNLVKGKKKSIVIF